MKNRPLIAVTMAVLLGAVLAFGAVSPAFAADEDMTFGMIIKYPGVPYIEAFIQAVQDKAEELGVNVIIRDGTGDSLVIMELMDTFALQGVDGIIMAGAVDLRALVPGVLRLNQQGIPITAIDTSPEGGRIEYFITADIEAMSAKAARYFVEGIKERHGGEVPEGVVIEITGDIRDMFTHAANRGFRSVIDEYPQLRVVQGEGNWNNIDAHERTSDLLTRYGDEVVGIYVQTPDIMGPGTVSAVEAAGYDPADFSISGIWMAPEGQELIRQGKILGAVAMPAYVPAQMSLELLYRMQKGLPVPQLGDVIEEEGALWSPAVVRENPFADEGLLIELQAPFVPIEASPDDPRLWENRLADKW